MPRRPLSQYYLGGEGEGSLQNDAVRGGTKAFGRPLLRGRYRAIPSQAAPRAPPPSRPCRSPARLSRLASCRSSRPSLLSTALLSTSSMPRASALRSSSLRATLRQTLREPQHSRRPRRSTLACSLSRARQRAARTSRQTLLWCHLRLRTCRPRRTRRRTCCPTPARTVRHCRLRGRRCFRRPHMVRCCHRLPRKAHSRASCCAPPQLRRTLLCSLPHLLQHLPLHPPLRPLRMQARRCHQIARARRRGRSSVTARLRRGRFTTHSRDAHRLPPHPLGGRRLPLPGALRRAAAAIARRCCSCWPLPAAVTATWRTVLTAVAACWFPAR